MRHPLADFLFHLLLALIALALLAAGIVLMLIFTAIDAGTRLAGKLKGKRR